MINTSKRWRLDAYDFVKGLLVAILSAVLTFLYPSVQAGQWVFDWKQIITVSITAGLAYLVKNWASDSVTITPKP